MQTDEDGKQLAEFLAAGRPDKGMPKFDMPRPQVSDIAATPGALWVTRIEDNAVEQVDR